jgi:hypothetical protein
MTSRELRRMLNRLAERNYELCRGKIVLAAFVGLFNSKFVLVGNLSDIDRTELFMPMSRSVSDLSNRNATDSPAVHRPTQSTAT